MADIPTRITRRLTGSAGAPSTLLNAQIAHNEVDDTIYVGKGVAADGKTATSVVAIAGKGAFVDKATEQTISGKKTFSGGAAISVAPSASTDAVRKTDLDTEVAALQGSLASHTHFQPNPDFPQDAQANTFVQGYGVFVKETQYFGTFYNLGGFFTESGGLALVYNGTMFVPDFQDPQGNVTSPAGNRWALISDDGEAGYGVIASATQSGGAYPWSVSWNNGLVVTKNPTSRLVGAPLAATASEGTSAYAARADHVHPLPTPAAIGAASLVSGRVPASQLPSYVDDVVEAANFASLPKENYTVSGSTRNSVNGSYVITASRYNNEPTYSNGNFTLRLSSRSTFKWEFIDLGNGSRTLLANNNAYRPDGSTWPESVNVVYSEPMSGKIYVTLDNNKCYRWTGSTYIEISSTLELQNIQTPDSRAGISAGAGNFWDGLSAGATQTNGKNHYYRDGDGYNHQVLWTGSQWKIAMSYSGDGNEYAESVSTSDTTYPWQATGWTNNGAVTRVGTYDAALAPAPLGLAAYSGVGAKAAREDHVHPLPTHNQLGLGTMSTQNANNVAVTGGTVSGVTFTNATFTDLVIDGGNF